jgi:diaminopimelate epimerase
MIIEFTKMSGSGNDFIVIDNREDKVLVENSKSDFVRKTCRRRASVGADGVLFLENSVCADFRMRYFNADGGEVEFCGNGGRCIAHFAHYGLGFPAEVRFDSGAGIVSAKVEDDFVALQMPMAGEPSGPYKLDISGDVIEYYFINTGVPHVVIFSDNISSINVVEIGRAIRFHENFAPEGTNANFVRLQKTPEWEAEIRTYERGVEDETLACGTGVTAAALIAAKLGYVKLPIRVRVALPDILTVDIDSSGRPVYSGEVKLVYFGKINI